MMIHTVFAFLVELLSVREIGSGITSLIVRRSSDGQFTPNKKHVKDHGIVSVPLPGANIDTLELQIFANWMLIRRHFTVQIGCLEESIVGLSVLRKCLFKFMSAVTQGLGDAIAQAVFEKFNALPAKSKPALLTNGIQTWIPLSGIVISHSNCVDVECISLG